MNQGNKFGSSFTFQTSLLISFEPKDEKYLAGSITLFDFQTKLSQIELQSVTTLA